MAEQIGCTPAELRSLSGELRHVNSRLKKVLSTPRASAHGTARSPQTGPTRAGVLRSLNVDRWRPAATVQR
jgi:hypothetical protein